MFSTCCADATANSFLRLGQFGYGTALCEQRDSCFISYHDMLTDVYSSGSGSFDPPGSVDL